MKKMFFLAAFLHHKIEKRSFPARPFMVIVIQFSLNYYFLVYLKINEKDFFDKLDEKGLVNLYNWKLDKRISYYWMVQYFKLLTEKFYNQSNPDNELVFNFHSYRTNYINSLCRASNNFDEVSKLVGHKNIYTTFIYWREIHVDKNKIKNNINKALL